MVVALYVDDTSLRLLVTKGKSIAKWADLPLEAGLVKDGVIVNQAEVAARIKQLLETETVKTKKVVAGLSGLHCVFRLITLPRLSKSLLAEAVRREAERTLPVPLQQLYLSWQVISVSGNEMLVFLAAFPRYVADALIQTLRSVALDPYLIDLKPLALARAVTGPTAIIVDVQPADVDIVVVVDRVPQLIRTLSLPIEAQSWLEKLPLIKGELDRTTKFYNSSHSESRLDSSVPVFVSGELAGVSEACESLAGELKCPVLPLPSALACPQGLPVGRFMVNIGLAMKEVSLRGTKAGFSVVNLNALPDVYRPKVRSLTELLTVPSIVVAIGLLAFLGLLVQGRVAAVASLRAESDTTGLLVEKRQAEWQAQMKAITELQERIDAIKASDDVFVAAAGELSQERAGVNGDLSEFWQALPYTVQLTSISRVSDSSTVGGVAPGEADVLTYARELRASRRFSQVIISDMTKREDGVISFVFILLK